MAVAFLKELDFSPPLHVKDMLDKETKETVNLLKTEIKRNKIQGQVFIGGSFAKHTLVSKKIYDVDVYIRMDINEIENPIKLEKALKEVAKVKKSELKIIHGSRDYYQIQINNELIIEIIPVLKISKPEKAKNVTDLSYYHVDYVNNRAGKKMQNEILLAKKFCQAQGVYGAESWIEGLSGYALECLVIYYKSFLNFVKAMSKIEIGTVIDPAKHYKIGQAKLELNESKIKSPIILVDPTFKERNAASSLSLQSFSKLQESSKQFIKKPAPEYFVVSESRTIDLLNRKKKEQEYIALVLTTEKQEGDIAGTKLRRAADFIEQQIKKRYEIEGSAFDYTGKQNAILAILAKYDKNKRYMGPPNKMEKAVKEFKKAHKDAYLEKGKWYSDFMVPKNMKSYVQEMLKLNQTHLNAMSIVKVELN